MLENEEWWELFWKYDNSEKMMDMSIYRAAVMKLSNIN